MTADSKHYEDATMAALDKADRDLKQAYSSFASISDDWPFTLPGIDLNLFNEFKHYMAQMMNFVDQYRSMILLHQHKAAQNAG